MSYLSHQIQLAIEAWKEIKGLEVVGPEEFVKGAMNTIGSERKVVGLLKPTLREQISAIVKIANQFKIPIYTVSTGRNWGYGSILPTVDNCVILNLCNLNKILHFDSQLGSVTVEPGVTQQQLYDFITEKKIPFMVPTTGVGPEGSLLGNALEKGYGITPIEDHFSSLLSLKAILPDGSLYQSTLAEMGGYRADSIFKWKLGPCVEGLFAQSNFGIVTEATLALARKPESVIQFVAFIDDENFEQGVVALRNIKQKLGAVLGGVNLMNKRRMLAMVEDKQAWKSDQVMSEMELRKLAKKRNLPDWAILGGIYTPDELTAGAKEIIRQELRPFAQRILFLDRKKIQWAQLFLKIFPLRSFLRTVQGMSDAMNILEGIPSRVALPLAYLKSKKNIQKDDVLNPDQDGCGLIWFSPLLPIDPALVRDFTQEVTRVCIAEGIEPLITLTSISERCFDSTIPLVFDGSSQSEKEKARKCYDALIEVAREFGIFPYRLDIDGMRKYFDGNNGVSVNFVRALKQAVDPNGIISPGRYS